MGRRGQQPAAAHSQMHSRVLVDGDPVVQARRLQVAHERGGDVVGQVGELDLTGVPGERDVEDPEAASVAAVARACAK
ncbi:hypothetical protein [Streptomyces sp. HC307]|uniref:hypothetical protein n=1 Tax=Streptomyces flavusporus TaxID=3385496 RepID=UPI0039172CD1